MEARYCWRPGAQAVGVQVFPGQETFQAVGVALHQNVQGRSGQGESPAQVNFARSGHKHDAERGQGQGYGGAHVLFKKNQGKRNAEDKAGHHKTPPERGGAVPVQGQPVGQGHHHAEFGAFAGLELHADGDPAAFPVDFLPDAGHIAQHQQKTGPSKDPPDILPPYPVVYPGENSWPPPARRRQRRSA